MLAQGFLRVTGQALITTCYLLWVDAINMKSLSGHYLMRQQAPMVFSLHLVYLSTAACISEKNKVVSMLAQGFLRVKGQAKSTKCYFLWVGTINMQSLSGHYLMRQQVPMVVLLLLVYLGTVAYSSVEIRLDLCWRKDILRVKGQALFTNCNFLWLCDTQSSSGNYLILDAPSSTHGVYTFSLSKCCCLHFCRNKFGLLLTRDILRVKGQALIINCNFLWLCVQSSSGNYSMRYQVPMVFLLLVCLLKCCCLHFWRKKFGSMFA